MIYNKDLIELIIILRFGPSSIRDLKKPLMSISSIAKSLKISRSSIYNLLKVGQVYMKKKQLVIKKSRTKLKERHITYLLEPGTLKAWAHLSLKQRVVLFHRQFPELTISTSLLQRTYKKHGIKFKYIQKAKKILDYTNQDTRALFDKMYKLIKLFQLYEKKIVFLDEAVFSFNTFKTKAWAGKYQSVTVEEDKTKVNT